MQQIKQLIATISAYIICVMSANADISAIYNWSNPSTLTPAYEGPTADNRYGEYISNIEFTDNGVSLTICDDNVKESSQKARFLYGYTTQTIEMRAYPNSDIVINAPEGMCVAEVSFEGAKADEQYLTSYDEGSTFKNGTWHAATEAQEAKFYVDTTINCTKITVKCANLSAVSDITADSAAPQAEKWITLSGCTLNEKPTVSGVYIYLKGNTAKTILIR